MLLKGKFLWIHSHSNFIYWKGGKKQLKPIDFPWKESHKFRGIIGTSQVEGDISFRFFSFSLFLLNLCRWRGCLCVRVNDASGILLKFPRKRSIDVPILLYFNCCNFAITGHVTIFVSFVREFVTIFKSEHNLSRIYLQDVKKSLLEPSKVLPLGKRVKMLKGENGQKKVNAYKPLDASTIKRVRRRWPEKKI